MYRILHTGDWHGRDKDIEECRKVLEHLADYAVTHSDLDLIVITGDLTDRNDVKFDSQTARLVIETVGRLSLAAPVVIAQGTRSHDGSIPELMGSVKSYHPIHVSTYPEQIILDNGEFYPLTGGINADAAKMMISIIPTPTKQFLQQQQGSIEESDQQIGELMTSIFAAFGANAAAFDLPHVLVGHWQVGGAYVSETQQLIGRDIEISVDQILSAQPTVACLGHIHMAQQIGIGPIFYCGSAYRKDFGELDPKGFYVHSINQGAVFMGSEFIEAPTRKLLRIAGDFTGDADIKDLGMIIHTYGPEELKDAHIRVDLKLWQDHRDFIDKEQLEQSFVSAGCASATVHIAAVPRANVRATRVLQVERLREKIQARAEIVGDVVDPAVLNICDRIETEPREELIREAREAI